MCSRGAGGALSWREAGWDAPSLCCCRAIAAAAGAALSHPFSLHPVFPASPASQAAAVMVMRVWSRHAAQGAATQCTGLHSSSALPTSGGRPATHAADAGRHGDGRPSTAESAKGCQTRTCRRTRHLLGPLPPPHSGDGSAAAKKRPPAAMVAVAVVVVVAVVAASDADMDGDGCCCVKTLLLPEGPPALLPPWVPRSLKVPPSGQNMPQIANRPLTSYNLRAPSKSRSTLVCDHWRWYAAQELGGRWDDSERRKQEASNLEAGATRENRISGAGPHPERPFHLFPVEPRCTAN